MSATLTKTYNIAAGTLQFVFDYDNADYTLGDFDIVNISPLSYGYDSANTNSLSVYPSNITLTVTDFDTDNYDIIKTFYARSRKVYPFTAELYLKLTIKLNNTIIFIGTVDELSSSEGNASLTITFTDGINLYKGADIGNPYLLAALYTKSLIPKGANFPLSLPAKAYGFGNLGYVANQGYYVYNIENGDKSVNLGNLVTELIRTLRSDLNIEFNNQYKYGEASTPVASMVTLDATTITRVMSYLFGRYVVITKTNGYASSVVTPPNAQEYQKAEYFTRVFEDDTYVVYRHTWSGTTNSLQTFYSGIDETTIAGMLQVLARNTFSYFGLRGDNTFFFKHKRFKSAPVTLTDITSMSKAIAGDEVSYVKINDYFTNNYGTEGRYYGTADTIEYKIPLNAYQTDNGWFYSMTYNSSGVKQVQHFYDEEISVKDLPQEVIAAAEFQAHNTVRDQYDIDLYGIDYDFDSSYSVNYGQYQGTLRPITLEKDLLNYRTRMSGVEI